MFFIIIVHISVFVRAKFAKWSNVKGGFLINLQKYYKEILHQAMKFVRQGKTLLSKDIYNKYTKQNHMHVLYWI